DASADDDRSERRRELATEREDDCARHSFDRPEALEAEAELDRHDHTDEDRGHRDDAERPHAEHVDLLQRRRYFEGPLERRADRPAREEHDLAEVIEEAL